VRGSGGEEHPGKRVEQGGGLNKFFQGRPRRGGENPERKKRITMQVNWEKGLDARGGSVQNQSLSEKG